MSWRGRGRGRGEDRDKSNGGCSRFADANTSTRTSSDEDSESNSPTEATSADALPTSMRRRTALNAFLRQVDGSNYAQLKQLTGRSYSLSADEGLSYPSCVSLRFLRIQQDPFAPGSQICVTAPVPFSVHSLLYRSDPYPPCASSTTAEVISVEDVAWRRVAVEDFLHRAVRRELDLRNSSGAVQMLKPSQHILPRSTVQLIECAPNPPLFMEDSYPTGFVHVYLRVKLPGRGRRIDGAGIQRILLQVVLPSIEAAVLRCSAADLWKYVTSVADQEWLRRQLRPCGLVAFIANGAILPRASGDADTPLLSDTVVPFISPSTLSCSFTLPYSGVAVIGAGLPRGLTLIAGGGFHGKSTLLRALELGICNHVPDDGRTFVVVDPTAVKIRAEDRRAVSGVDIRPFISHLPNGIDTTAFTTADASGSTSQAANIMEALELGASALLLDEDTSATNFMYRDAVMEQLVPASQEPITAFVHRVRDLVEQQGVSVLMVVGGSGQYIPVADLVLVMDAYHVRDATKEAKAIVQTSSLFLNAQEMGEPQPPDSVFHFPPQRHFEHGPTFAAMLRSMTHGCGGHGLKVSGMGVERVRVGDEDVLLHLVEQLVEEGQLNAIAQCIALLCDGGPVPTETFQQESIPSPVYPPPLWKLPSIIITGTTPPQQQRLSDFGVLVHNCERRLRQANLELQTQSCYLPLGFTALPRVFEIGAALNRLRTLITIRR